MSVSLKLCHPTNPERPQKHHHKKSGHVSEARECWCSHGTVTDTGRTYGW